MLPHKTEVHNQKHDNVAALASQAIQYKQANAIMYNALLELHDILTEGFNKRQYKKACKAALEKIEEVK